MIRFWFIKQIKWPWNYYAGCVCRSEIIRNSLVKSFEFVPLPKSLVSCSIYSFWGGGGCFWFTAFNIVTNIVYKSINFAMCQFMRFSATHFTDMLCIYSLIIDECMRMEIWVSESNTNYRTFATCRFDSTMVLFGVAALMRSHKNNKCCGIVLFWLFGWNNFCKCIRRYSINFMFIAYCLIILVVYT